MIRNTTFCIWKKRFSRKSRMTTPLSTNTEIRSLLAAFLFTGDDVFKPISTLSGGERGRVSLAKLMLSEAVFVSWTSPPTTWIWYLKKSWSRLSRIIPELCSMSPTTGILSTRRQPGSWIHKPALCRNYIGNYDYYLEKKERADFDLCPGKRDGTSGICPF